MNYWPYVIDERTKINLAKDESQKGSTEGDEEVSNLKTAEEKHWWKMKLNRENFLKKLKEKRDRERIRTKKSMEDMGYYFY
ncbi:uncharacterized protein SOCG_01882 [Schizosaccharomyces octosporus yFS286]|uniref:Uncharacterized protein n=1 Tax=Schizosaccharomyces octosporus (strain yFS286) TaxID=483514 RepID=S9PUL6_SCHOY|nr:uncharacterized protein SOCG_01882 [Schizosaccharomyces octosporus yFS286]EPX71667.1 hypothetical protein SOCG_01882 [Schizosaccharomyces octosporus yFS286]